MLNELNLLSHNARRLLETIDRYQQDLHELKQVLAQTCTTLERVRGERDNLRTECESLRHERKILTVKIEDTQIQLNAVLESLPAHKAEDNQPNLLP